MDPKIVLITGGTGTFGKAMTRFLLANTDATIRIFSRSELPQVDMQNEFENHDRLRFFIGDIRDASRLNMACRGVDALFHAAALKHVNKSEYDPTEFTLTNVNGTMNVINACIANGVKKAVFISTDKCVHPINTYGATKMLAERLWIQSNSYSQVSDFVAVRYGNVSGSRGSVIPFWKNQIESGINPMITSPSMTRFWISIEDAIQLACFAFEYGTRGYTYIPVLGAYSIVDLLFSMFPKGKQAKDYRIIGIRPGEKLHEQLMTDHEMNCSEIYIDRDKNNSAYAYAVPPVSHSWRIPGITVPENFSPMKTSVFKSPYSSDVWPIRLGEDILREKVKML